MHIKGTPMLSFTVTVYGINEHAERNAAQRLQAALLRAQELIAGTESLAMLIGQITAKFPEPRDGDEILH